jgi:hypothetical protein
MIAKKVPTHKATDSTPGDKAKPQDGQDQGSKPTLEKLRDQAQKAEENAVPEDVAASAASGV